MTPKNWTKGRVDDFFVLQRGFDITESSSQEGNIPVISSSGFSYFHSESKVIGPGVVTGRKGRVGPVYYVEENHWPHDTTLWVKDFKGNVPQYVYYFLQGMKLERYNEALAVPTLNRNNVHPIKCIFPPVKEQEKIVGIFSLWDKTIEKTKALVAAKENQFKWLASKLINESTNETDIVLLSEVAKMSSGGTPLSSIEEYYGGDISWVSIADMTSQGKYITQTKKNITKKGLKNSSAKIFPKGTILYAMYASIGECSIAALDVTSSQAILGIQPSNKLDNQYLYYYLSSLKEKIKLQGQQGTQSNLNAKMVKNFKINLPSFENQKKISHYLTVAHNEIDLLKCLLEKYRTQKRGLMQKLLTGEWQVNIPPQSTEKTSKKVSA